MYLQSCFEPPVAVHVVEVIQVSCTRGQGDALRNVTQLWTKGGDLIAEHDEIHADPIYASFFLRESLSKASQAAAEPVEQGV